MKLIIIAVIILALAVGGIAIKLLLKKNGEFKKSCSTTDPETGEKFGCTCSKAEGGEEQCENFKIHHPEKT
jgi:flagellar basal body-associated protein FliL